MRFASLEASAAARSEAAQEEVFLDCESSMSSEKIRSFSVRGWSFPISRVRLLSSRLRQAKILILNSLGASPPLSNQDSNLWSSPTCWWNELSPTMRILTYSSQRRLFSESRNLL